ADAAIGLRRGGHGAGLDVEVADAAGERAADAGPVIGRGGDGGGGDGDVVGKAFVATADGSAEFAVRRVRDDRRIQDRDGPDRAPGAAADGSTARVGRVSCSTGGGGRAAVDGDGAGVLVGIASDSGAAGATGDIEFTTPRRVSHRELRAFRNRDAGLAIVTGDFESVSVKVEGDGFTATDRK